MSPNIESPFSPLHDPACNTDSDVIFRKELAEYFETSIGSTIEKLENFSKYIPRQRFTEALVKYEIFKKILNVHGSIVELGVLFGGGLMTWHQISTILEPINYQRPIIGFDTFSGFPSLSNEDELSTAEEAKVGGLAVDSYEDLLKCIEIHDKNRFLNHFPKTHLVKGDATQSIPKYINDNPELVVSLLYLDADIYEPTKVAITSLLPRMPKGAIICFDELMVKSYPGETLALLDTIGISNLKLQRFSFEPKISYAVID